jgi:hypothetical protein
MSMATITRELSSREKRGEAREGGSAGAWVEEPREKAGGKKEKAWAGNSTEQRSK